MRFKPFFTASLLVLLSTSSTYAARWQNLLDADLNQWQSYISFKHQQDYDGEIPLDADGQPLAPIGIDKDPHGVFTVKQESGEPVLHISCLLYTSPSPRDA